MALKATTITFTNRPNEDGTVTPEIVVKGCLVAPHGASTAERPQIRIHLPKTFTESVEGAWVEYEGQSYHVIGTSQAEMLQNTPTTWNRYAILERIRGI